MSSKSIILIWFIALLTIACEGQNNSKKPRDKGLNDTPYLVILSLDGFRWDYTNDVETPNFDRIAEKGVKAESLQSSFPSKTFPNHYTIATGLYPGHHGLVNNSFYDYDKKIQYKISDRGTVEDKDFYGGEPIWNTAEKQGVKSACFFWVGSEAPVQGMRPSIWKKYDHDFPWNDRADSIISWLSLPEKQRPHLLMWYVHQPDSYGHKYGPDSKQIAELVQQQDKFLGRFLDKLEALPHANQINFILTTDHGMGATSSERYVALSEYLEKEDLSYVIPGNPVVFLEPEQGKIDKVYAALSKVEHISVTRKGERPSHWHYNENKRIAELVVVADSAWSVGWGKSKGNWSGGTHGYDPTNKDMHGIFYAQGPAFKTNYVHPTFQNVDIYSLISHILNLESAPNDGDFNRVRGMLQPKE